MKWTRSELNQYENQLILDEDVVIDAEAFQNNSRINAVRDVHVSGHGYLDEDADTFYVDLHIEGTMLLPDAVTGEEISYPFETESEEIYSFEDTDEDGVWLVADDVIDLLPAVIANILLEVPMQVTIASSEDYPKGDGWRVVTEEEYQKDQQEKQDPRWDVLKQFKKE